MVEIAREGRRIQECKFSDRGKTERRKEGITRLVNWNIAGAKNITEAWEYFPDFD